jgi:RNA polymerase sigma factor (sigma-70 family)
MCVLSLLDFQLWTCGCDQVMSENSEELIGLLCRAKAGEAYAINQLLSIFRPDIRQWIEKECGCKAATYVDVSGVTQNSLLCVYRELARFQGSDIEEFRSWVKRISINRLVDEIRSFNANKRGLTRTQSLHRASDDGDLSPLQVPGRHSTPSVQASRKELLLKAIAKLPAEQQMLASGRFVEQLGIDEIAARLGISAEDACVSLERTMRNLKKHLRQIDR